MARFDLTDFEWSVIQPLLPNKVRGVERSDDRMVLNGIFWRLRTGAPWADIPGNYPRPNPTVLASPARRVRMTGFGVSERRFRGWS
jgi:transposase